MAKLFSSLRNTRPEKPSHSGTVGILTSEHGRYSRFWLSMLNVHLPPMTKLITKMSLSIAEARNEILREAEGEWVWFMDDDHTFEPGLLRGLMARNVDIIQPLVLTRYGPFSPVMMGPPSGDGIKHWRYALSPDDTTGLKSVHIAGCAGMLIRRRVWEAMEYPYFTNGPHVDSIAEDVRFCQRARELGFGIYVDLDNRMGHLNIGEVWPERNEDTGEWTTKLVFGQEIVQLPAAQPKLRRNNETGEVTPYDASESSVPEES